MVMPMKQQKEEGRETIRCPHCDLLNLYTNKNHCGGCKNSLTVEDKVIPDHICGICYHPKDSHPCPVNTAEDEPKCCQVCGSLRLQLQKVFYGNNFVMTCLDCGKAQEE